MNKYIAIALSLISSQLYSGGSCCPSADPCAKCAQIWPSRGPDWIITPGAGPCVSRGWDAFLTVDFIYWTSRVDNLGFALYEPIENGFSVTGSGQVLHPDWKFSPGFKVGVGLLYDHDGWDLYVNYTWLRVCDTKESKTIEDFEARRLRPIGDQNAFAGLFDPIVHASGDWELAFNALDAELGRNFFISRYLKLRPHIGLKGTWQDQDYVVRARDLLLTSEDKNSMHYWGIGIRGGLNSTWHFNQCFSLIGAISASGMWEKFNVKRRSGYTGPFESAAILHTDNDFSSLKPVLELFIGLRYESWICCDRYHYAFDGGWELQWWGMQNQFFNQTVESTRGDLNLNGFTLKARLDF